jgi:hypothetical protein
MRLTSLYDFNYLEVTDSAGYDGGRLRSIENLFNCANNYTTHTKNCQKGNPL